MRITCPTCAAEYDVPDSLLAARRTVRCARCGHDWAPSAAAADALAWPEPPPPAPYPSPEPPASTVPQPQPSELPQEMPSELPSELPVASIAAPPAPAVPTPLLPAAAPLRRGRAGLAGMRAAALVPAAWAASIALLAGMTLAGYAWRAEVAHAWPPSTRLYALFGLPPDH